MHTLLIKIWALIWRVHLRKKSEKRWIPFIFHTSCCVCVHTFGGTCPWLKILYIKYIFFFSILVPVNFTPTLLCFFFSLRTCSHTINVLLLLLPFKARMRKGCSDVHYSLLFYLDQLIISCILETHLLTYTLSSILTFVYKSSIFFNRIYFPTIY